MERALNPIRWWLVTPTFMPLLHQCAMQAGNRCRSQALNWVAGYFSPLVDYGVSSVTVNTNQQGWRLGLVTNSSSLCPVKYVSSSETEPFHHCGEQSISLVAAWDFGGFHGAPLANDSTRCHLFLALGVSCGDKRCLLRLCLPRCLVILFRLLSFVYTF